MKICDHCGKPTDQLYGHMEAKEEYCPSCNDAYERIWRVIERQIEVERRKIIDVNLRVWKESATWFKGK